MDIQEINALHRDAMEQVDLALIARRRQDAAQEALHFRQAYDLESTAAMDLVRNGHEEPARSVLLRSAAALALNCDLLRDAEKLIFIALLGEPPVEIAEELKDLYEQVTFHRHLALQGITLEGDELQVSISGDAIGHGIAPTGAFLSRVEHTETLLYRTAERKQGKKFHGPGRRQHILQENVELFMTIPRASSFAVTFKVGRPPKADVPTQRSFPGLSLGEQIVDEFFDCLDLVVQGDEAALRERIPDEAYYENFIALAKNLVPDGKNVSQVGFTIIRGGKTRDVALRAGKTNLLLRLDPGPKLQPAAHQISEHVQDSSIVQVAGVLKMADDIKNSEIQLLDGSVQHSIFVPEGLMDDIVRPLWGTYVVVTAVRQGERIRLQDIRAATPDGISDA